MSGLSFLFLSSLLFQPHLKTVPQVFDSASRFSVFQAFGTSASAASPAWKLSELSLLLILQVIASVSVPQKSFPWLITLSDSVLYFSLQYSVLFSPDSLVVYIILIFFTTSPQCLLQILHTVGTQEAHLTGMRAGSMLISSCMLSKEHPGTWQAFLNLYTDRSSCWCFCSVHFCFLSGMGR